MVAAVVIKENLRLAIADPPYLGRAKRWYGVGGCGNGYGVGQADQHPDADYWDTPQAHQNLVCQLENDFDGWAIAMSVHSLSTYLKIVETDSRNGIRVCVWHKPSAVTSGNRITNSWEPVLVKVPKTRKGWKSEAARMTDVLSANPLRSNFIGAKPPEWTNWVLDLLGYQNGDEVIDLFLGSGAVTNAINTLRLTYD
jgi:hypothetical protein